MDPCCPDSYYSVQTYEQQGLTNKQHNFEQVVPKHRAEQADQAIMDVYLLNMPCVQTPILEAELKLRIVSKIRDVMLALGYGLAFIGNQYCIFANDTEEHNYFEVEYALRRLDKPVGVSEYELTNELPSSLQVKLSGVEQFRTQI